MFAPRIAKSQSKSAGRSSVRFTKLRTTVADASEQRAVEASVDKGEADPLISWNFSEIPLFPTGHKGQGRGSTPFHTTYLPDAIPTRLVVGKPGDEYEREAERVADQITRMPEPQLQRRPCKVKGPPLQSKHAGSNDLGHTAVAPHIVHEVLRSSGQSLDPDVRAFMEPRFGYDLSSVRVHSGRVAEQSAKDVSAHAYTVGNNIVFGAGQFAPWTPNGRRLLAHELAHVVQQTATGALVVQRDAAADLRKSDETSGFASFARTFWSNNGEKSLEEFGLFLIDKANAQLIENGVVPILDPPSFGPAVRGEAGGFRPHTWKIELDLAKTADHPLTTKIKDLTADQIAELAGICYHEARHAEQAFLVARVVASEAKGKKDAKTIAAEIDVPEFVAKAALNSTEPLPGKDLMAQIEKWRAFGKSGKHQDYWDWNENFRGYVQNVIANLPKTLPEGVDQVTSAWTAVTPTIASWRKDSLPPLEAMIDKRAKAKTSDTVDTQVLTELKKIRAGIQTVIKADKALSDESAKFQARKATSEDRVTQLQFDLLWADLEVALRKLGLTTTDAYRAYAHEADAYATEESVIETFKSKPKTVAPKP